ncbi:UNC93-like protein isoform X1 [Hydra vulgaris]|uniref:UNC93-like protein isoform X1 n=2 Tax=Hydra vulgaris TaxID=6087 RepID=UPI0001925649|nr:UNC93-like protein isoform X1 [Hydra vulgaris]
MTAKSTYKNLVIMSVSFFFLYAAYLPLQNIQSSLHKDPALGFGSLSAIYASGILSCCFLPNVLIAMFKLKTLLILSIFSFPLYVLANFVPRWSTILPASILLGLSGAVMWTCQSIYITQIATSYADTIKFPKDSLVSKFFSIFYFFFQFSQIVGNGVSSAVLTNVKNDKLTANFLRSTGSFNVQNITCGAKYCPSGVAITNAETLHINIIYKLMSILLSFTLIGILIAFFMDPLSEEAKTNQMPKLKLCFSTIKNLKNPMILLLVPITIFNGMEQGFVYGEYTKAFVACSLGIDVIGYSMICFGSAACFFSMFIGFIVKWSGTYALMIFGMFAHLSLMTWFLVWDTQAYPSYIFYICALCCGVTSSIWMSQTNAIYAIYFSNKQGAAFSIFRLFQSSGFTIAFVYGNILCVSTKIYILMAFLVVSIAMYSIVEFKYQKNHLTDVIKQEYDDKDIVAIL